MNPNLSKTQLPALPTLGDRLKYVFGWSGPAIRNVSEAVGVAAKTWERWCTNVTRPDAAQIVAISELTDAPLDWLLKGTISSPRSDTNDDIVVIPVLGISAATGPGAINHDDSVVDHIPFSRAALRRLRVTPEKVEAIRVRGDSMEPTLANGAIVLVDRSQREVREDAIYAISMGEDVRVKRIRRSFDGSLALISDNKALYPEERLSPADAEQLKVHGRVFWTERLL